MVATIVQDFSNYWVGLESDVVNIGNTTTTAFKTVSSSRTTTKQTMSTTTTTSTTTTNSTTSTTATTTTTSSSTSTTTTTTPSTTTNNLTTTNQFNYYTGLVVTYMKDFTNYWVGLESDNISANPTILTTTTSKIQTTATTTTKTTTEASATTTFLPNSCLDTSKHCSYWASEKGFCSHNAYTRWMSANCQQVTTEQHRAVKTPGYSTAFQ